MLNKRKATNQLLDRMHRGVVWTCIGLTFYGTYLLGMRFYNYYTIIRPSRKEEELKKIHEGSSFNDTAKELKT